MWQNTLTYGIKNNTKRKNEIAATLIIYLPNKFDLLQYHVTMSLLYLCLDQVTVHGHCMQTFYMYSKLTHTKTEFRNTLDFLICICQKAL